ncbi:MAG: histidine phosphatase family protein [Clostridia bacterium]|nr:histidine phosphatase family protein [Clostridia bacterium]
MKETEIVELELFLVRHGESMGNAGIPAAENGFHPDDPPLTEKGLLQARLLGAFYKSTPFDCILSSGLVRAAQTAAQVALQQERPLKKLEVYPLLTECGMKPAFGFKSLQDLQAAISIAAPAVGVEDGENLVYCAEDEEDPQRYLRAQKTLCYLRSRFHCGERVMAVGHAAFNTFLVFAALGLGAQPGFDVAINNTGVTKIVFFKEGTGPYDEDVHLVFHNDHTHLAGRFDREWINTVK